MHPPATISARRAQTQQRLLDAALQVFAERGLLGGSVEEICERAGFTRGAFYSNFASKEELCLALLRRTCDQHVELVTKGLATSPPTMDEDDLVPYAAQLMELLDTDREITLFLTEVELFAARSPEFAQAYRRFDVEMTATFVSVVRAGIARLGLEWTVPEADGIELLRLLHDQRSHAQLTGRTFDNERTSALMRPLLAAVLRPARRPAED